MLALITLYIFRPPFIAPAEDLDDEATYDLPREPQAACEPRATSDPRRPLPRRAGGSPGCLDVEPIEPGFATRRMAAEAHSYRANDPS
jgi:hypothetical protein